ncbi:MAG: domain containing protein [Solirubrobacterales bacterium]|jgi:CHAD domain-containing protein|nr:domain containing protein [Solirubrobacterales bacterium]
MTTDRTAIRRRLAVRRTAHSPPWGRRKAGHRPIVAPLAGSFAASFAATLAVGVGVAIARAERERRAGRRRHAAERQFALLPAELPVPGLRRMALGQLDLAIDLLDGRGPPDEKAVHEIRKALKRLRALVRLLRQELGEEAFARENGALRDAGRRLAGARDAEVMLSTLDRLIARHKRRLGRRRGVGRLREALDAERKVSTARALGDEMTRAQVLGDLRAVRHRVAGWQIAGPPSLDALEQDLQRLYRQGRKRMRRAARGKGDRARAMHEWRKRVKDLRYAAEMLERRDPGEGKRRRRRSKKDAAAKSIHRLARRADKLGEALGEEHDLAVLAQRIGARGERGGSHAPGLGSAALGRRNRRTVLKLIARRRRKLRSRTLRDGARIYRRRPKKFLGRVRRAYERASVSRR